MEPSKSYIPDLQLQSLAIDFIDKRLDKYHPAFATPPARYDPALGSFIAVSTPHLDNTTMESQQQPSTTPQTEDVQLPPRPLAEPAKALKFWDSIFVRAMDQFKLGPKEPKGRVEAGFSIRDKKDWTAVFDILERAKQLYFKGAKITSAIRRVYRKMADHLAPVVLDLTNLVPETGCMFVTPVLGSVQIILEAVKKAAEVRKEIEGSFEDIDMMFSEIELFLQTFPEDENIDKTSIELVVATFFAIESVIGFLIKSVLLRIGGVVLKRDEYERQVLDALGKVQSKSQRLIRQAENSEKWMISQGMRKVLEETGQWKREVGQIRQDLKNGFKTVLDDYMKKLEANIMKEFREERAAFLSIIEAGILSRPASPNPPPYDSVSVNAVERSRHIEPQELLDWIDIPDVASADLERLNERRQTWVLGNEQARAEQLVRSSQFKDWMVSGASSQLLVHGDYEGQRYVSGLSLFCSSFVQSLAAKAPLPHFIPLIFFCGLHTDRYTDKHTGGRAIIQNFICQLLCQFDFDTRMLATEKLDEGLIQRGDVDELCKLFQWLVSQLPRSVVLFCLLDGVVYYERKEFEDHMGFVLEAFLRISAEQNTQAAVKILLTSPSRTSYIRKPFPDELVLSIECMARSDIASSKWRLERELNESQEG
ncbi:hypothetical protein BDZ45DRAFT_62075 [Acephala macrosclerotiorum]|nr:hypothetical protein BDZ45DRAFT_62075 [Acephala macrosclerotiorum]